MLCAVAVLLRRNCERAAALLVDVEDVEVFQDHDGHWQVLFRIEEHRWDRFTSEVWEEIADALPVESPTLIMAPPVPMPQWRSDVARRMGIGPTNQASRVPWSGGIIEHDSMRFRDRGEVLFYEALKERQLELPPNDTLGIAVNPSLRVRSHTWEPDFVVTYRGCALAIEIDAASHSRRYASDRTRDELLDDAGLRVVRIPVEDTESPDVLSQHIDRIVARLRRR